MGLQTSVHNLHNSARSWWKCCPLWTSPGLGQLEANVGRHRPNLFDYGPKIDQLRSKTVHHLGETGPSLLEFGPNLPEPKPDSADTQAMRTTCAPLVFWRNCCTTRRRASPNATTARTRCTTTPPSKGSCRTAALWAGRHCTAASWEASFGRRTGASNTGKRRMEVNRRLARRQREVPSGGP